MRLYYVPLSLVIAAVALSTVLQAQAPAPVRTVKDGILDEMTLYVEKPPKTSSIVMLPFSATDADIVEGEKKDETKKLQADGPRLLAEAFAAAVKEAGAFTSVSVIEAGAKPPADALGRGRKVHRARSGQPRQALPGGLRLRQSPPSRSKARSNRPTAPLVASFKQRRVGVMGMAGGDSVEQDEQRREEYRRRRRQVRQRVVARSETEVARRRHCEAPAPAPLPSADTHPSEGSRGGARAPVALGQLRRQRRL